MGGPTTHAIHWGPGLLKHIVWWGRNWLQVLSLHLNQSKLVNIKAKRLTYQVNDSKLVYLWTTYILQSYSKELKCWEKLQLKISHPFAGDTKTWFHKKKVRNTFKTGLKPKLHHPKNLCKTKYFIDRQNFSLTDKTQNRSKILYRNLPLLQQRNVRLKDGRVLFHYCINKT